MLIILVCAITLITGCLASDYCNSFPGDVAFSYSTTQDESYWFQNYQNAYVGAKKGFEPYLIYRHRVITRGHRRGPFFGQNALNNEFVQQQQVQQVQVPVEFVPSDNSTNDTEEEAPPVLPIWKITIPRQVKKAVIARIEDSQVVDHFELNQTHFQNPNLTTSSSSARSQSQSNSFSQSTPSIYTRTVDVTDQSIITNAWYVVCLQVNVVQKGKPATCDHCTLIQARNDSGRQYFLDFDWTSSITNTTAELRYVAMDLPFPSASLITKIRTRDPHPRCRAAQDSVVFTSKDAIFPDHFLYLDVNKLVGKMVYAVQVDVEFPWFAKPLDVLPIPFVLVDYLHSDQISTTLSACDNIDYNWQ